MCNVTTIWPLYHSSKSLKESTMKREVSLYHVQLEPYWKDIEFHEINNCDIVIFAQYLKNKELSEQSIKHCLILLRSLMKRAQFLSLYSGSIPTFEMPKIDNQRLRYLSKAEALLLLRRLKHRSVLWHDITLLALTTGMRASEIFSIRKAAINLDEKTILLRNTKNSKVRTVELTNKSFEIITKYYSQNLPYFFSEKKIVEASSIFKTAVRQLGFNEGVTDRRDKVVFHTLRHTYASWLVQNGRPLEEVSKRMGHSSLQMTMRYAHLAPNQGREAVELIFSTLEEELCQENI